MQEIRRFKPSTVSRRFPVAAGFYKTCVIDGLLEHPPAEHVRRPPVPPESPTLGFTHLQFEALLTAARASSSPCHFALVALPGLPGLPGLRIFEATGADIADLGEEHGHRMLRVCGKSTKIVLVPLPPAVGRAIDQAVGTRTRGPILLNSRGARMDRHAATRRLRRLADTAGVRITRPHGANLSNSSATLPGGNPTVRAGPGLLAQARYPVREDRHHGRGPSPRACGTAPFSIRPDRPWNTPVAGCPPTVSAADGHGMILTERRVDAEDATYRVARAGPGR
jgi:site-specific recombinase XerC